MRLDKLSKQTDIKIDLQLHSGFIQTIRLYLGNRYVARIARRYAGHAGFGIVGWC